MSGVELSLVERIVLAAASLIERYRRVGGTKRVGASLYDLNKVLAKFNELYRKRTGQSLIEFVEYSYGPYSPQLETILEQLSDKKVAEYCVTIHVPEAPHGVESDFAWLIVKHQWSERDADRKYVRKVFRAKVWPELPRDIEELLQQVVREYFEGKNA